MDKSEYDDIEKTANYLQSVAANKASLEITKVQEYEKGYKQGVEDLLSSIRRSKQNYN